MHRLAFGHWPGTEIPGARAFSPLDLGPALCVWIDALRADVATDDAPVALVTDRSVYSNHAIQNVAEQRPVLKTAFLNGYPILRFDGANDVLSIASHASLDITTAFTLVMCVAFRSVGAWKTVVARDEGAGALPKWIYGHRIIGASPLGFHINNPGVGSTLIDNPSLVLSAGVFHIYILIRNGATWTFYIDSALGDTANDALAIPSIVAPVTLGNAESNYADIDLAEVFLVSRAVSASERQQCEAYLNNRYAIF